MEAVHLLATAYGWTKRDVLGLSYAEIQAFINFIRADKKREADYYRNRKPLRRR